MLEKPVELNLYDDEGTIQKTFKLCIIPWGIMKKATQMSDKITKMPDGDPSIIDEETQFLCDVFRNQFTQEEVNKHMDEKEVMSAFDSIMGYVGVQNPN